MSPALQLASTMWPFRDFVRGQLACSRERGVIGRSGRGPCYLCRIKFVSWFWAPKMSVTQPDSSTSWQRRTRCSPGCQCDMVSLDIVRTASLKLPFVSTWSKYVSFEVSCLTSFDKTFYFNPNLSWTKVNLKPTVRLRSFWKMIVNVFVLLKTNNENERGGVRTESTRVMKTNNT